MGNYIRAALLIWAAAMGSLLWTVRATSAVNVVGPTTYVFDVEPGGTYEGSIGLAYAGEGTATARLYVTDYLFNADGQSFFDPPGSHPRSAGSWIALAADRMVVPPDRVQRVPYWISIPGDATLRGTYWGMIMVELDPMLEPGTAGDDAGPRIGLDTKVRYGIQIVLNANGGVGPDLRLHGPKLLAAPLDDGFEFQVDIINEGDVWLRPDVWLELYDTNGQNVGTFGSPSRHIYPGTGVRQRVSLPGQLEGSYIALLFVDGGEQDAFAARFTLDIPAAVDGR